MTKSGVLLPITLLVIAMASIPSGAAIAKRIFPIVGAEGVTAMRLGIAAVLLLIVWRPHPRLLKDRVVWAYGLSLGAMNLIFYMAIARIPLGVAVALEFTGPLAVAGIGLLAPIGTGGAPLDPIGVALALTAGACWAVYIVFGAKAGGKIGPGAVSLGCLIGALFAVPIGVAHAGTDLLAPSILIAGLGVALLSSLFPYSLEMIALTRLPAKTFSVMMSLEPAFAALSGMLILHEALTPRQWCAIAAIMAASVGSAVTAKPKPVAPIPD